MHPALPRLAVLLLSLLATANIASAADYALTHANVFNGVDNRIADDVTVLVHEGKIPALNGADAAIPAGYEVIDCQGNYLLPGLFDVHTHLDNLDQAKRALESGVTTVRSASTPAYQDVTIRELARAGKIPGPDMVAAGVYVTPNLDESVLADPRLVPMFDGVQTDEQLRALVNINIDHGVDVIKTRGTERAGRADTDPREQVYTEHQLRVVVEEAAKRKVPVMVHAHGDEGARAAVLAGARSIEHGSYLSEETLKLMKERGTWLVPTYVTMDEMNEQKYEAALRLRGRYMVPQLERVIRNAHELGVKIATGADNYYEPESVNRISVEAEQLVRLGLSNFEALQSATTSSAELLLLQDKTGQINEGFEADMILVPANPLTDISALQDILLVMSNGQLAVKRIPFGLE